MAKIAAIRAAMNLLTGIPDAIETTPEEISAVLVTLGLLARLSKKLDTYPRVPTAPAKVPG